MTIKSIMEKEGFVWEERNVSSEFVRALSGKKVALATISHLGRMVNILLREGIDIAVFHNGYVNTMNSSFLTVGSKQRSVAQYLRTYKHNIRSVPPFLEVCYLQAVKGKKEYVPEVVTSSREIVEEIMNKCQTEHDELTTRYAVSFGDLKDMLREDMEALESRMRQLKFNVDESLLMYQEALMEAV